MIILDDEEHREDEVEDRAVQVPVLLPPLRHAGTGSVDDERV